MKTDTIVYNVCINKVNVNQKNRLKQILERNKIGVCHCNYSEHSGLSMTGNVPFSFSLNETCKYTCVTLKYNSSLVYWGEKESETLKVLFSLWHDKRKKNDEIRENIDIIIKSHWCNEALIKLCWWWRCSEYEMTSAITIHRLNIELLKRRKFMAFDWMMSIPFLNQNSGRQTLLWYICVISKNEPWHNTRCVIRCAIVKTFISTDYVMFTPSVFDSLCAHS